jgi:DNA repair protein RadC
MKIKEMPKWSKPSFRMNKTDEKVLDSIELLSLIIWREYQDLSPIELSMNLLSKYKLSEIPFLSLEELKKEVGFSAAYRIRAMCELIPHFRWIEEKGFKTKISDSKDVFNYFHSRLKDEKQENFFVLILDTKNKIIKEELVTKGVLDAAIVHPREIFKPAIRNSASKIILVHNHPSGDPNPSPEDLEITEKMVKLGEELDIRVLDHVIIGNGEHWSWQEDNC